MLRHSLKPKTSNLKAQEGFIPHHFFSKSGAGFTLVELIVAVGLFLSIMTIATGSFVRALRTQRQIAGLISAENNVNLVLEQMAREARTGADFCSSAACPSSEELSFTNAAGQPVAYRLRGAVIERGVNGTFSALTSGNVSVSYLRFIVTGQAPGDGWPPRITILVGVSSNEAGASAVAHLQTSVSARLLDT